MKIAYILILLSSLGTQVFSQNNETKITVYEPFKAMPLEGEIAPARHCIKWNIWLLYRGVAMLNYEKYINKKLTIEFGAGLTYADFLMNTGIFQLLENVEITPPDNIYIGYAFDGSLRFYPGGCYDFEGFYMSPLFRYRHYRGESNLENYNNYYQQYQDETFKNDLVAYDFGFLIGHSGEGMVFDWLVDYYFGVSYRINAYNEFTYLNNSWISTPATFKIPSIMAGLKIGFSL